jgi:putative transposase
MTQGLERRYGQHHLHFITCSCYGRLPFLGSAPARDLFLRILSEVRDRRRFALVGYTVMPEHIHLLIGEPEIGTPSTAMQVLKQRVSKSLGRGAQRRFWQPRFYDFNVWSTKKRNEKLHYIHFNPVKRGLVENPALWPWSSFRFYRYGEMGVCTPNPPAW